MAGIPWEDLSCKMGCGSGMPEAAAGWAGRRHFGQDPRGLTLTAPGADKLDWSGAMIDSSSVLAACGGEGIVPSPVYRAKPGSKHYVITDASGIPLASSVTAANVHDVSEMAPLINKLPAVAGKVGRPRRKPDPFRGTWPTTRCRSSKGLREMGNEPVPPERGIDDQEGLVKTRWPVERTLAWAHQNRRLRNRHVLRPDVPQAFLTLACI